MQEQKNWWEWLVDLLVDSLGYLVTRLALIVSPIPVIVVLLEAMDYHYMAWPLVISIEIIGYALGDKVFEGLRLKVLTIRQSIIPISIYTVVVEALMIGYRVLPAWVDESSTLAEAIIASAAIFYPLMTLFGAFLYAFHLYLQQIKRQQRIQLENERQQEEQAQLLNQRLNEEKTHAAIERAKIDLEIHRQREEQRLELERIAAESKIRMRESQGNPSHTRVNPKENPKDNPKNPKDNPKNPKDNPKNPIDNPSVQDERLTGLDQLSLSILDEYQKNPSVSQRDLAGMFNVSKTPIANRVKELRERGLMNGVNHG